MIADLRATYERIIEPPRRGGREWSGFTELSSLLGMITHSAYHLGEIRQMMCRLKG